MATTIPDLWPASFGDPTEFSPVNILRQQGLLLGQKTRNTVIGRVYSQMAGKGVFEHSFVLYAPLLGYEHPIVTVTHSVRLYPARIIRDPLIIRTADASNETIDAMDPETFLAELGTVLKSDEVTTLIRSLLAQSRPLKTEALT